MYKRAMSLILLFFMMGTALIAQPSTPDADAAKARILAEIDEQIWKPFIESYNTFDGEAFAAIHADDMIRASRRGVRTGIEYKKSVIDGYARSKASGRERSIEFWFEQRLTSGDGAIVYEVGYYHVRNVRDGKESHHYARFHVFHRKKNGAWLMYLDWDASEINGAKVTAEVFNARKATHL